MQHTQYIKQLYVGCGGAMQEKYMQNIHIHLNNVDVDLCKNDINILILYIVNILTRFYFKFGLDWFNKESNFYIYIEYKILYNPKSMILY